MLKERKTAKPSNRKMFASKKAKGLNKIAEIVKKKKITYEYHGRRILALIIITLSRNCKLAMINISNKPCQYRNTDYWAVSSRILPRICNIKYNQCHSPRAIACWNIWLLSPLHNNSPFKAKTQIRRIS